MKKLVYSTLLFLLSHLLLNAQVVTTDPEFPTQENEVTIFFNAAEGNGALAGFNGDVYAHTGVITSNSSSGTDWQHVIGNWGMDDSRVKMTAMGNDVYSLTYTINDFYNVSMGETVNAMAFVFRDLSGNTVGRDTDGSDIFVTVYSSSELQTSFSSPSANELIVEEGETINIVASASASADLSLFDNGTLLSQATGTSISYDLVVNEGGNHVVELIANDGSVESSSSFKYIVTKTVVPVDPPSNIEAGINYLSDSSVGFSLYAPTKEHVFLIGDFNNWTLDTAYQMNRSISGSTFWLEVDGLTPGEDYTFQYYVDGNIKIGDPYSELVLDPGNDAWIPNITYPNLPSYPDGKTSGFVSVIQPGKTPYAWATDSFEKPKKTDLVIYELLIRDFVDRHDYQTLIDSINYFKNLGINAIELMPNMEFGGNLSWGYNPIYHMAVDKYYGPPDEFKRFIDVCHENGIAVILDVVYNHADDNSPLAQLYWDATNNRPASNSIYLNTSARHDFNVFNDMNHESQATKDFVDRTLKHWVEEYRIDGFRFDLSKGFTQVNTLGNVGAWGSYDASRVAILKHYANTIWSVDNEAYVILEHFAANNEETELANNGMMLWGNMNHEYNEASMAYSSNLTGASYTSRGWNVPHLISYMESHDEERMNYKNQEFGNSSADYNVKNLTTALKRQELASAFYYPIPGPKMLWQFGEVGYDYSINYCENGTINESCRTGSKPIRWDYFQDVDRRRLYDVTSALIHLKTNYEVFETTDFQLDLASSISKRIHLNHSEMNVVVLGNFNVVDANIDPGFQNTGMWYEYFTGDSLNVLDVNEQLSFFPGEYRLYTSVRLDPPAGGFLTTTNDLSLQAHNVQVFPNPTKDQFQINYTLEKTSEITIELYNLLGQRVDVLENSLQASGTHQLVWNSHLPNGQYLIKLTIDGQVGAQKLTIQQ